jgi:non-specific serine/threonine protein kinase
MLAVDVLARMANLAMQQGDQVLAASLIGCQAVECERLGIKQSASDVLVLEQTRDVVRAQLGETAFLGAYERGRSLAPVTMLQQLRESPSSRPRDPLTAREREIATLLVQGLGNREIAEALVISEATVERHVSNILGKLGVTSRRFVGAALATANQSAA